MYDGWGDEKSCDRCGHPASYHGVTFCQVDAGSVSKKRCDCSGWKARAVRRVPAPFIRPSIVNNAIAGPQTRRGVR